MKEDLIPVIVNIKSSNDGLSDQIDMTCTNGVLRQTPGGIALRYEESLLEDGSDEIMTQTVILFADNGTVKMNRVGEMGSSMVFTKGVPFSCNYCTPYGSLEMNIMPITVSVRTNLDKGTIFLEYYLTLQMNPPMHHTIEINYHRKQNADH